MFIETYQSLCLLKIILKELVRRDYKIYGQIAKQCKNVDRRSPCLAMAFNHTMKRYDYFDLLGTLLMFVIIKMFYFSKETIIEKLDAVLYVISCAKDISNIDKLYYNK